MSSRVVPAHRSASTAVPAPPREVLLRALAAAFGDAHTGPVLIQAALRAARRTVLPPDALALLDFVRAYLMGPLTEELGPRLVSALIDDLADELAQQTGSAHPDPPSVSRMILEHAASDAPKSSGIRVRPSLLLVDADRFARASLARALITSAACDVDVAEGPMDVRHVASKIDVAVVNMSTPEVAAIVGALVARNPDVRVIGLADDVLSAESLLRAAEVRKSRVVPRSTRPTELADLARRMMLTAR